jgi:hypothetical protein
MTARQLSAKVTATGVTTAQASQMLATLKAEWPGILPNYSELEARLAADFLGTAQEGCMLAPAPLRRTPTCDWNWNYERSNRRET